MGLFGQTKRLSGRSNVPSIILIGIPLIFLILLVYKYFELVSVVYRDSLDWTNQNRVLMSRGTIGPIRKPDFHIPF